MTIAAAILVSGFVSLTLTPMLCSRFLRPPAEAAPRPLLRRVRARSSTACCGVYRAQPRRRSCATGCATLVVSGVLLVGHRLPVRARSPRASCPSEDTGQIFGFTEARAGHLLRVDGASTSRRWPRSSQQDPNVDALHARASAPRGPNAAGNQGRIFMRLKPRSERKLSADEVIEELRPKLAAVPGIRVFLQNPPPIRIGGQLTKSLYQFTLQGPDTDELYRRRRRCSRRSCAALPGLQDVTSDLQIQNPQVNVAIDRDQASALGVTAAADRGRPLLAPTAPGRSPPSTRPTTSTACILELLPRVPARPVGALAALHPLRHRQPGAARARWPRVSRDRRAAHRQPPGPAARGDASPSTSSRARRWATPSPR